MTKEPRQGFLFEPMRSNEEVLSIMRHRAEKASSPKFNGGRSSMNIGAHAPIACACLPRWKMYAAQKLNLCVTN